MPFLNALNSISEKEINASKKNNYFFHCNSYGIVIYSPTLDLVTEVHSIVYRKSDQKTRTKNNYFMCVFLLHYVLTYIKMVKRTTTEEQK